MPETELTTGPEEKSELVFFVNGRKVVDQDADPEMTLLTYLRTKLRLTGAKLGCGEGGCGACTVMVSRYSQAQGKVLHLAVNACLAPICSLHGAAVTTVEGIGSTRTRLHPVQERLAKAHGSQCGFCTPGIVMSMYTLLRNHPCPDMDQLEAAFQGNLCRCTGYRPILEGYKTFTKEFQGCCGGMAGNGCCRNIQNGQAANGHAENGQAANGHAENGQGANGHVANGDTVNGQPNGNAGNGWTEDVSTELFQVSEFRPLDPTQEPIFPPELMKSAGGDQTTLKFVGERVTWIKPATFKEVLELKTKFPQAKLVVGNSEVGVEVKFKNCEYPLIIAPGHLPEINFHRYTEHGITFGAGCTLTYLNDTLTEAIADLPEHQTRLFAAIVEMLRWFAGHQIRNVGCIGGNIVTASPISDLNPIFLSAGCTVTVASHQGGSRVVRMDHDFFPGYRRTAVAPEEVMVSLDVPFTKENEYFLAYKQARRRDDDIAIVNAAFRVRFEEGTNVIRDIGLSFGGMAPTTVMARNTANRLTGLKWDNDLLPEACSSLEDDLPLPPSVPGGMAEFRRTLTTSFFFKFFLSVQQRLNIKDVPPPYRSACSLYHRESPHGSQMYQEVPEGQGREDAVGRPIMHLSALKQVTGEAVYTDDMPPLQGELYVGLVLSKKAHAKILSIDPSAALQMPGVEMFVGAEDVPGSNITGPAVMDEEVFASEKVTCVGQVVGAVLADTQAHAQRAAKSVAVQYEDLEPKIITIEDAILHQSFFHPINKIEKGNLQEAFEKADQIIEGELRIGGQEHFYLETCAAIVVPHGEDGEMEIYCSTQNPAKTQMLAAKALGVPANRVVCRVKRMGGGFGGKETRTCVVSSVCAVAAHKAQRPVRIMLDRDEDMMMIGTRHPFLSRYKVGFMNDGRVVALDISLYNNAGNSLDLSRGVMDRALFHSDGGYTIPNVRAVGYVCKTNTVSNTAFRGFGGPQGLFFAEGWISDVAIKCGISQLKVRELNMNREGDLTHYNMKLERCQMERCWQECVKKSDFHTRRRQVNRFNGENRWKKRGLAAVPTKFGISFTATFLNQAGALVHVYTDGSVLLTHGGTEMGQGLHTKMVQVASRVLRIPTSKIHISETSTNTVPNTSPTAASASSDLNGMAVKLACETILQRLEPYMGKGSWEDWVRAAYFDRVGLSATGFYRTPGLDYDMQKNEGRPFNYFCYGAAVSEVEIDCLTGDHTVLRTDIVMDVGDSLNPAIDIGQIEGAFVQGYGLFTMEEQVYSPDGVLYSRGPGMYKIPGFADIPVQLNVSLLRGAPNDKAIFSSKAVGEPPLFLASSVFFAIKDAVSSARADAGLKGTFRLDSPATAERIRMACQDQFTAQFPAAEPGSFKPWAIRL
ncbi:PREDICTED: xanthine dehydrogenase/oxidase-like [Branchiostoma belcheri]|uniref:Xanthine dehydrogenase/oxidase n=1 Tax=Branchiostoma belcheri TaxID=7741 RepID=A0A6P5ALA6_BRABE|nr:PREDICTED: xanthine dehydrogenase/oxidase-like [Branchiostoma belcheri]